LAMRGQEGRGRLIEIIKLIKIYLEKSKERVYPR